MVKSNETIRNGDNVMQKLEIQQQQRAKYCSDPEDTIKGSLAKSLEEIRKCQESGDQNFATDGLYLKK